MAKPCLDPTLDEVKDGWPRGRARLARAGLPLYAHWDTGPRPGDPGGPGVTPPVTATIETAPARGGFGRFLERIDSAIMDNVLMQGLTGYLGAPRMRAGNDRALRAIVDAAGQMEGAMNRGYPAQLRRAVNAWGGLPPEDAVKVQALYHQHRDTPTPEFLDAAARISPATAAAAERWRPLVAEDWAYMVNTARVKPDAQPTTNYLPGVRQTVVLNEVLGLGTDPHTATRLVFKQLPHEEGFADPVYQIIPKRAMPFFTKRQVLGTETPLVPFNQVLDIYARAQAGMRAKDQFIEAIKPLLPQVAPGNLKYTLAYVNTLLGRPGASSELWQSMAAGTRLIEASRLLGYNLAAALRNLTQPMDLPLVGIRMKNVGLGFIDSFDPRLAALAEAAGLPVTNAAAIRADLPAVATNGGAMQTLRAWISGESQSLLGRLTNPLGLFQAAERRNLLHAFASGLREAGDRNLSGDDALRFAMGIVDRTQYSFRATRTPLAFHTPLGSVLGQMKTFDLNRWGLLRDALVNRPADFAKWLVGLTVMFGPDVIWPGLDEGVTKRMFGEAVRVPGIVPWIGASLAESVGMPGVQADDVRRFFAFLPGPAIAHVADAATFLSFMVSGTRAVDFGKLVAGDKTAAFEGGVSYDRAAAAGTRSLPFMGVFADRARRALRTWQADGDVRESLDLAEAFGLRPAGAFNTLQDQQSGLEQVLTFTGLTPDRVLLARRALRAEKDVEESMRKVRVEAGKLMAAERLGEAFELVQPLLAAGEQVNLGPRTPQQLLKAILPPAERRLLGGVSPAEAEILTPSRSVFEVLRGTRP